MYDIIIALGITFFFMAGYSTALFFSCWFVAYVNIRDVHALMYG